MRNLQPVSETNKAAGTVFCPSVARRWELQRLAQRALRDTVPRIDREGSQVAHFVNRVCMCHRGTDGAPPSIKRNRAGTKAKYTGLQTCGSVWTCPICSAKICAERRAELMKACDAWTKAGGVVLLATYTFSHSAEHYGEGELQKAVDDMSDALRTFKGARPYRRIMERAKFKGAVRALETTYSWLNGWHVHTHELIFVPADGVRAVGDVRKAWCRHLIKRDMAGLLPGDIGRERWRKLRALLVHACTVQGGTKAADYVAKFGADESLAFELTHSQTKRAANDHLSPWAMLAESGEDAGSLRLFREYAAAFKGRRQLFWSKGLKEYFFGIADRTDEEIAGEPDTECTEFVCDVPLSDWHMVIACNKRLQLLQVAARHGREGVRCFMDELRRQTPTHNGDFTESGDIASQRRQAWREMQDDTRGYPSYSKAA